MDCTPAILIFIGPSQHQHRSTMPATGSYAERHGRGHVSSRHTGPRPQEVLTVQIPILFTAKLQSTLTVQTH